MTYAIGRPAHLPVTGIRSRSGMIHRTAGWSAFQGTRTLCGRTLKHDGDYYHLSEFTPVAIRYTFEDADNICPTCLKRSRNAS